MSWQWVLLLSLTTTNFWFGETQATNSQDVQSGSPPSLEFDFEIPNQQLPPIMDLDQLKGNEASTIVVQQRSTRDIPEEEQGYQLARTSDLLKQCDEQSVSCLNSGFCDTFFPTSGNGQQQLDTRVSCMCPIGYTGRKCETEGNFRFPEFAGNGYLIFALDPFDQISLTIGLDIRPKLQNGILLYANGRYPNNQQFMALVMRESRLQFRYNNGDGLSILNIQRRLDLHSWHRVTIHKSGNAVWIQLNNTRSSIPLPANGYRSHNVQDVIRDRGAVFQLKNRLYLAGFPRTLSSGQLSSQTDSDAGFVGCVSNITLNKMTLDPRRKPFHGDALSGMNVYDCASGTCNHHRCKNDGKCKVLRPPNEYMCQCHNATGKYCERPFKRNVTMPYFNGRAYLKLKKGLKKTSKSKTEVDIVFRAEQPEGLIMYSGYSKDTRGDFIAIGLKNQRVQVSFDLGSGPAVIESRHRIDLHKWTTVKFFRSGRLGTLQVSDQGDKVEGYSPGHLVQLTIKLDTFLGGHKNYDEVSEYMKIRRNFVGCIQKVSLGDLGSIRFPDDTKIGMNVVQCSNHSCADYSDLCGPGGECVPQGAFYQCQCRLGYAGSRCEQVRARRAINAPQFTGLSFLQFRDFHYLQRLSLTNFTLSWDLRLSSPISDRTKSSSILCLLGGPSVNEGDQFLLLTISQRHLSMQYNEGYGHRSRRNVYYFDDRWHTVAISKMPRSYTLYVDGIPKDSISVQESLTEDEQFEQLLIGGLDPVTKQRSSSIPSSSSGLSGCIRDLTLSVKDTDQMLKLSVDKATDGRNIDQCSPKRTT